MGHKRKSFAGVVLFAVLLLLQACAATDEPAVTVTATPLQGIRTTVQAVETLDAAATQKAKRNPSATPFHTSTATRTPTLSPTPTPDTRATFESLRGLWTKTAQYVLLNPSATPEAPSRTPLPTSESSPTLVPDFRAPAATATPRPRGRCPQPDPDVTLDEDIFAPLHEVFPNAGNELDYNHSYNIPDVPFEQVSWAFHEVEAGIAAYLNQGGDLSQLKDLFSQQWIAEEPQYYGRVSQTDVTGDRVPEIIIWMALPLSEDALLPPHQANFRSIFPKFMQWTQLLILTCENNEYVPAGDFIYDGDVGSIRDMPDFYDLNRDGIKEIIQPSYRIASTGYTLDVEIMGWDGSQINKLHLDLLYGDYAASGMGGTDTSWDEASMLGGRFEIRDVDYNGTYEVVIAGGGARDPCGALYRETKLVLMWNGHGFSSYYWRTPLTYRIQAVWDGDRMANRGLYEKALGFFYLAINDDDLLTWSPDYAEASVCEWDSRPMPKNAVLDEGERDRLMAYSLYRMMRLRVAMGDMGNAEVLYNRLVTKYATTAGYIYVQLGTAFWEEYQSSGDLELGHQAAVAFAADHNHEVCYPLTDYYDYSVEPVYFVIDDVCPNP